MSNPSINRWGMNVFWHHFWYSDTHYSQNAEQDKLMTELVNTYLYFGLATPFNFFMNPYWFFKKSPPYNALRYYRFVRVLGRALRTLTTYRLRVQTDCIFPMRIWILKFQKWIVLTFYWFQPWKRKKYEKKTGRLHYKPFFKETTKSTFQRIRRYKASTSLLLLSHRARTHAQTYLF